MKSLAQLALALLFAISICTGAQADDPWLVFEGDNGPGAGKHIVLVSGDEEYRSEEALPQLGKILAAHHGFKCTVLFAVDDSGIIQPNQHGSLPGLNALDDADLMIIATRFRTPNDESMEAIDRYLKRGGPVIGLRTATHAFKFPGNSKWAHYGNGYKGEKTEWAGGFGRLVIGEQWVSHHGAHKSQGTRGRSFEIAASSPIMRGVPDGAVWGSTDVYGVKLPMQLGLTALMWGESTDRQGPMDKGDLNYGMTDKDPAATDARNDVKMPIAWTKTYEIPGGKQGKTFATTMGSAADLTNAPLRRMLVNAVYWSVGMEDEISAEGAKVDIVGDYKPTKFEFRNTDYWTKTALTPADFE